MMDGATDHDGRTDVVLPIGTEEVPLQGPTSDGDQYDNGARLEEHAQKFMKALSVKMSSDRGLGPAPSALSTMASLDSAGLTNIKRIVRVGISWDQLTYTVPVREPGKLRKTGTKVVLRGLSGAMPPGRLLAVMGPTGCGKTSLINALAGRLPRGGELSGTILANNAARTKAFRNISAYVMQDDVLFSNLTVRETLRVAADLRLPRSIPAAAKAQVVEDIIGELSLVKAADTWIGNDLVRGVSGGERKRTNIGVEMMGFPSLVFLDEPTSGLDAFQAQNVMEALWSLAKRGRTVLCTVHQPRSSIFRMFDLLCLVSEGRTMYFGPAAQAVGYFRDRGFACPEHYNPADFFLDLCSVDYRSAEAEASTRARVDALAASFQHHGTGGAGVDGGGGCGDSGSREPGSTASNGHGMGGATRTGNGELELHGVKSEFSFTNTRMRQFGVLFGRAMKQTSRDLLPLIFSFVLTVLVGTFLGLIYLQNGDSNDQRAIQDRIGVLFFVTLFAFFSNFQPVLEVFPAEQSVVRRERASKSYAVLPYYLSKIIAETPTRVVSTLLFAAIVYWMVGLNPGAKQFFTFYAVLFCEALTAISFGIMISAAVPNPRLASAIAPAFLVLLMLFGGFYANQDTIPVWLSWIRYISFIFYAFSALMVNEFQGECCFTCNIGGSSGDSSCDGGGCLRTGDQVLDRWGFGSWPQWAGFAGLLGALTVQHTLGYMLLRFRSPKYQPLHQLSEKGEAAASAVGGGFAPPGGHVPPGVAASHGAGVGAAHGAGVSRGLADGVREVVEMQSVGRGSHGPGAVAHVGGAAVGGPKDV